jgi:hypothetical protein
VIDPVFSGKLQRPALVGFVDPNRILRKGHSQAVLLIIIDKKLIIDKNARFGTAIIIGRGLCVKRLKGQN